MEEHDNPYLAPYAEPEQVSTPSFLSDRLVFALNFPYLLVGPLPWGAAALASMILINVLDRIHHFARFFVFVPDKDLFVIIIAVVLAIIYGFGYAVTLAVICRILNCRPRIKLHFWVVVSTSLVVSLIVFELDQLWTRAYTHLLSLLVPFIGGVAGVLTTCLNHQRREPRHTSNTLGVVRYD